MRPPASLLFGRWFLSVVVALMIAGCGTTGSSTSPPATLTGLPVAPQQVEPPAAPVATTPSGRPTDSYPAPAAPTEDAASYPAPADSTPVLSPPPHALTPDEPASYPAPTEEAR